MEIKDRIKKVPCHPGVYLMKDGDGEVLYIGKANDMQKRVASYFKKQGLSPKIAALVNKICDIDYIETPTEVDALILEARLIQKYAPRYNTRAKDDKTFPFIRVTGDKYPMLFITRRKSDRKSLYFGPFTDSGLLREAVSIINRIFPLRKCVTLPKKACLYYHLGQCLAPCIKPEIKPLYDQTVKEVTDFIGGGKKSLVQFLEEKMYAASNRLAFEEAHFYKEQIQALSNLKKKKFSRGRDISGVSLSASGELAKVLGLSRFPERIVCFDISNISGKEAVASRVSFYYEMPDKNEYRRYRIKTVQKIDDYAMMREAVGRMLNGIKEGREAFIPDLIMIDGGRGHLNAAYEILEKEGFKDVPIVSLAKRFEHLFLRGREEPVILSKDSKALHLVQRVRDEAHRFAITYHRHLHNKLASQSILDQIEGVGDTRKKALLKHFGTIEAIRQTPVEELAALPGMNKPLACKILAYLG